jgi:Uma2 family endonuclease
MQERLNQGSGGMSVKQRVTAEELWDMPDVPGRRFGLTDGELVDVPGAGALSTMISFALARLIDDFVREHDLGLVLPDGLAYVLRRGPDQVRIPDVSFVAWERVSEEGLPEGFWEGSPTMAVEVVSPHDRADDIHERVQDYLAAGSRQVWVLWPRSRSVSVSSPDADTRELGPDARLDGGDILPGFGVRVGELFEVRRRR